MCRMTAASPHIILEAVAATCSPSAPGTTGSNVASVYRRVKWLHYCQSPQSRGAGHRALKKAQR